MSRLVIDASAVIAILQGEPGADTALDLARGASFSAVNLAETLAKVSDHGVNVDDALSLIDDLRLEIVPFDRQQAAVAASLRPPTRYLNVSQADRACLALAMVRRLPVLTGDRDWSTLAIGVETILFR